ncbi:MAG TPA: transketolase [Bacteroidales bacterium]|nr:transketolase [Bacteroidales bacterium]HOH22307.1 transketolase [Bacteroidales bacterium]HPB57139.1 transketolase [Bacteroidales bacterium]HPZ03240.1 transketolase [Bacteroidales bacterium]HQB74623.1 transketolase [Bacteroidales bacterium]
MSNKDKILELESISLQVRRDIVRMVNMAKSGHPGGSLGCADMMTALYFYAMNIDINKPIQETNGEDLFFLSNGHISPLLYSVLARRGYFPISELAGFRKLGSRLQGHPTPSHGLPGIRIASGSLGQGLSVAVGAAYAKKYDQDSSLVYVMTGDGELQEGQNWEAIMFAASHKIDNLIAIVDYNNVQIDGKLEEVISLGDLEKKWIAFGWEVLKGNGNKMQEVVSMLDQAKSRTGKEKPVVILMRTEMGMGVDFMMGSSKWHGVAPNDEQTEIALQQLPETLGDF